MRSRPLRFTCAALAWIALGAAAYFIFRSEKQIATRTAAVRSFDLHAREAADALADLRAAQQAYVAAGQGVDFWMPKVANTVSTVTHAIASLRADAASDAARSALAGAGETMAEFGNVDQRAREYIRSGDQLMAGDVIFTEGGQDATAASRDVEQARLAEHQAFDAAAADVRRQEAMAAGGAAVFAGLIVLVLLLGGRADQADAPVVEQGQAPRTIAPVVAPPRVSPAKGSILKTAADLATEFGRIRDLADLNRLLGRAADVMDASGLVVWLGNTSGGDLHAVASHGYSQQVVARMPTVPRSADNAAAKSYRTGAMQIVLSRPGGAPGALVAPLLAPDGCIGALSAEIRSGGEGSESVQALAAIFAAHIAAVFAGTATEPAAAPQSKAAAQ